MNKKLLFWGIDGCPDRWFCVGLDANGEHGCFIGEDICAVDRHLREKGAKIALIDIPIGLSDSSDERSCDKKARKYVGERKSSVFRVPCRKAIDAYRKTQGDCDSKQKAGKIASVEVTGGCLSKQTWGIASKIVQVDCFLNGEGDTTKEQRRKLFREVHPEVCFRAFNGKPLQHPKKNNKKHPDGVGLEERLDILGKRFSEAKQVYDYCCRETKGNNVAKDDILDAMAAAITAKIGFGEDGSELKTLRTLPPTPPKDSCGLPMEMLYVEI